MILFSIRGHEYRLPETWEEITIAKGIQLYHLIKDMPEKLRNLYDKGKKQHIGDEELIKVFPTWYGRVIGCLADVPEDIMQHVMVGDRVSTYKGYCEKFVLGIMNMPVDYELKNIANFEHKGHRYHLPTKKVDIFGKEVPGGWMEAIEFTEAADTLLAATKLEKGTVEVLPLLIAIMCRRDGEKYSETLARKRADEFMDLPLSVAWEVLFFSMSYTLSYVDDLQTFFSSQDQEL